MNSTDRVCTVCITIDGDMTLSGRLTSFKSQYIGTAYEHSFVMSCQILNVWSIHERWLTFPAPIKSILLENDDATYAFPLPDKDLDFDYHIVAFGLHGVNGSICDVELTVRTLSLGR